MKIASLLTISISKSISLLSGPNTLNLCILGFQRSMALLNLNLITRSPTASLSRIALTGERRKIFNTTSGTTCTTPSFPPESPPPIAE